MTTPAGTPAHTPADALTAMLLQITQHAERLAVVDEREAGHYREIAARLAELARHLGEATAHVDSMRATAARQAAILASLDGLDQQVAAIATRLSDATASRDSDASAGSQPYQPAPGPRWWSLDTDEREEAIARLRAWVDQVYRPGYGHLATALGPCWEQHPLCLYGLDWLMELWTLTYTASQRQGPDLASQAEWQTRLLPALAGQMHLETTRCQHAQQDHSQHQLPAGRASPVARALPGRD
jgi:hypothetical protein